jgi:hypothetical protein
MLRAKQAAMRKAHDMGADKAVETIKADTEVKPV